ncbi:cytochrome P450 [Aspergillus keveii]|uniref:Cytochrome P450 n=1 Tax=Aspergillus keveii TaxID=714993 RepID=A0ABR4FI71_9EURO
MSASWLARFNAGSIDPSLWLLTLVAVLFGTSFVYSVAYNLWFHPLRKVPGPLFAKIFNQYMVPSTLRLRRAQRLEKLHREYGPVVRVAPNEVSIADWKVYREIYSTKANAKTDEFYAPASFLDHENIFSMRNKAQHAARRKMQSQPYSQQAVLQNEALIADKAEILVRRMMNAAKGSASGVTADVYPLCGLFSLEVILKCAFNRDYGESLDGDSLTFCKAMDQSQTVLPIHGFFHFIDHKSGVYVPGSIGWGFKQFNTWVSMTAALCKDFQQHESAFDKTHKFMVTPLLVNKDEFLGRQLTQDEIVEEAMGIAFAGSGTTSTTLCYLLYSLSRPEGQSIHERLQRELQGVRETLREVQDLPLLNAVINETMRLYPAIVSTLPRILHEPLNVGDFVLPRGTIVGMQNYIHQRDPSLFPDPNKFVPDRWMAGSDRQKEMNAALTPFSLGPRNCIGQNLARAELYLATAHIFKRLHLTLDPRMTDKDMELEDRFNSAPVGRKLLLTVRVINND